MAGASAAFDAGEGSPVSGPGAMEDLPLFSERLNGLLEEIIKGQSPNAGRLCGYCYTPTSEESERCPHCGRSTREHPPQPRVPPEVIRMFRNMRRRESIVVNGFALAGLALAVALSIGLFAMFEPLWWRILDIVLMVLMARVFAGILGGFIGDHIGYGYARRRLTEEWKAYMAGRCAEASPTPADPRQPDSLH